MTKTQFRWLVTVSLVVSIASTLVSLVGESRLPQPLRDYIMAQRDSPYTSRDVAVLIVGVPLGIAWIVSIVGLYCFWRIARPLTVLTWIMILIVEAVSGPSIDLGIVNSLFQLDALLGGIIIAVIYLPPAKAWFEKRAEVSSAIPAQAAPS